MKLESVDCNNCGAPLDVPEGANYVTCTHCDTRLAVRRTEGARFTEVIDDLREQVAKLTRQNEIEALDREWEHEKEQYMVTGKHGHRSLPTKTQSVVGGAIIAGFGTIWTIMAVGITGVGRGMGAPAVLSCFPLFGVLFVIGGVAIAISAYKKAEQYERAQRRYQQRRRELLDQRDVD